MVDARGVHSFVCKKTPGRTTRHHTLNDLIARGFASAGFPCQQGANGTVPDRRKATWWSYTYPMAEWQGTTLGRHTNLSVSRFVRSWSRSWGRFSGRACRCPQGGQNSIDGRYLFEPIAIETLGVYNTSARQLLSDLGRKISQSSGEVREVSLSEMLSAGAACQRSFTSQQFAGLWLHGLTVIPNTSFS